MTQEEAAQLMARIKHFISQWAAAIPESYRDSTHLYDTMYKPYRAKNAQEFLIYSQLKKISNFISFKYAQQTVTEIDDKHVKYADGVTLPIGIACVHIRLSAELMGLSKDYQAAVNTATVNAARQLTELRHLRQIPIQTTLYGRLFPEYFKQADYYSFASQPHIKPADAIKAVFDYQGQEIFFIECAIAMQLIHYKACLDILGEKRFNDSFPNGVNLNLGSNSIAIEKFLLTIKRDCVTICTDAEAALQTAIPGDSLYISNIYPYTYRHEHGTSPGINVVYLGRNKQNEHEFGGFFTAKRPYTYKEAITNLIQEYNKSPALLKP